MEEIHFTLFVLVLLAPNKTTTFLYRYYTCITYQTKTMSF